ncbi:MBL fold metallo-hydrolase [Brockia lithotrophica]|uniref:MBL fold metallo-hydrolase n=1 Tax=Brockia lithotrophica TaxID=933949 RepID=UPI001473BE92|nr:MBL fold metallo-hydrolase [Brockia lithotrophica]
MPRETEIVFHAGLRQIGGTVVEVRYGEARLLFDFGSAYRPAQAFAEAQFFPDGQKPSLRHLLLLRRLPTLDGVYRRQDLLLPLRIDGSGYSKDDASPSPTPFGREERSPVPYEEWSGETAVFISHFHLDHTSGLPWLHPKVPVYTSEESLRVWKALALSGLAEEGAPDDHETVVPMPEERNFRIGDIRFWVLSVDHNVPGASALFLETPDLRLVYSGDLRLHGSNPQKTARFVAEARSFRPDLLLLEGTSLPPEREEEALRRAPTFESALAKRLADVAADVRGPVLVHTYVRDAERLLLYVNLAKTLGRKALLGPKAARYLFALTGRRDFAVLRLPDGEAEEARLLPLPREIPRVDLADLVASPQEFFVHVPCTYPALPLDLAGTEGVFFHSDGMPYGPHNPAYGPWREAIEASGFRYELLHANGHAVPDHLFQIVRAIAPKRLVPVHTYNPERYAEIFPHTFLPEHRVPYGPKDIVP